MVYISADKEASVGQEALRYRNIRQRRSDLAKLSRRALELIDEFEIALRTTEPIVSFKDTVIVRGKSVKKNKRQKV